MQFQFYCLDVTELDFRIVVQFHVLQKGDALYWKMEFLVIV
jgi:hypothetical protein